MFTTKRYVCIPVTYAYTELLMFVYNVMKKGNLNENEFINKKICIRKSSQAQVIQQQVYIENKNKLDH